MTAKFHREFEEIETNYFSTPEFAALCAQIVELTEKAGGSATYRTFNESVKKVDKSLLGWVYHAVEHCKAEGWIQETGGVNRTIFILGGHQIKPDKGQRQNAELFTNGHKSEWVNIGL